MKKINKRLSTVLILTMSVILLLGTISVYSIPNDSIYNISDMANGNITNDTQIGDFTVIAANDSTAAIAVDDSKKNSVSTGISYTKRLKLNGTGSQNGRAIKFAASEPATFFIEAASANSSQTRTGVLVNSSGEIVDSAEFTPGLVYRKMIVPEAGDYWFYSYESNINVYYLRLTYQAIPPDPVYENLNGVVMTPTDTIYTAPLASSTGAGTVDEPMSIASAILNITAGGTIYCDGRYDFDDCLFIQHGNNGEEGKEKRIECTDGTVFDFSGQPYSTDVGTNARGVQINANYWYIKGLEAYMSADNGFFIAGKHNTLELCVANANRDTGIQISRRSSTVSDYNDWPSDNLILNCTSYDSFDPATGENADGFAPKLTCGDNNVFDGCIAYNNCDDGWDCFTKSETGPIGTVILRNCVAFRSGQTTDGKFTDDSDGNGFKMGGSNIGVSHFLYNCIAFENANHGFTDNSNPGPIALTNCTSFNNALKGGSNKSNFDFARHTSSNNSLVNCLSYTQSQISSDKFIGHMKNTAVYNKDKKVYYYFDDFAYTSWGNKEGFLLPTDSIETVTDSTFVSITSPEIGADVHKLWRNQDGSINMGAFLEVSDGTTYKSKNIGADLSGEPIPSATPKPSETPEPSETPIPSETPTTSETPKPSETPETSATPEPSATQQPSETPTPTETPVPSDDYILLAAINDDHSNMIDIQFDNNSNEEIEPEIIIALYKTVDDKEVLTYVDGENYMIGAKSSKLLSKLIKYDGDYDIIRVFAWSDINTMLPYTSTVEINQ